MEKVKELILKKPGIFLLSSFVYLIGVVLLKWGIHPTFETLWFFIGGAIGIYFLDGAELFFRLTPSPFRTPLFIILFAIVSIFVVTSSGSVLASGLVLSLYMQILIRSIGEWLIVRTTPTMLAFYSAVFLLESYIFIR